MFIFWRDKNKYIDPSGGKPKEGDETTSTIAYRIASLAIPISLGGLVLPVMQALDTIIVPSRLQAAGYAVGEATALFGQLTGMAAPLINLPTIFTYALATSLVPAVSEALSLGDVSSAKVRTLTALRITYMITLPAAAGLFFLAEPITLMLYNNTDAAIPLTYLAWGLIFLCLQQTTSGVLQGLGKTTIPVRNLLFGAIVKVIINYSLTGIPSIGIKGAAVGSVIGFYVASGLNLHEVKKYLKMNITYKELLAKPALAVLAMIASVGLSYYGLQNLLQMSAYSERMIAVMATLPAIMVGAVVYLVVLLSIGAVGKADLELLSMENSKPAKFLQRIGLLRR
jgi:stage V sporulation protein B